ncbi:hypothetical protein [Oligoflexus tunisiensis]|uniref:hypothetical protein n=1 Tax=Oligoflexus tunisiensis TaxID=708132 RepID=UPI001C403928|nr:hypothetical protein [Oligoflexus tunisiensis]
MILTHLKNWWPMCWPVLQLPHLLDRPLCSLILAVFPALFCTFPAQADQVFSLAVGAIEEGDERYRPEWIARSLINGRIYTELHYYGRIQGRVRQATQMLTFAYNYPMLKSKYIAARVGLALSRDEAVIRSADPELPTRSHEAYNFGAYFGLGVMSTSKLAISLDWNNAQFFAGSSGILLATARKQSLSLGVGWRI